MCGGQVVESYSYGAKGRTVTVTDGNGKDYLYNYSEFGRLTSEKNRLGDIKQYFYDTDGALESQNNFDGTTSSIIYNTDRTERRVVYSDGHVNRFIYDAMGNIVLAENEYGTTEYTYDRGGKLIKQSEKNGETVTFSYDASGNRIKLAGAGQETSYRYGKNNELLEVFDRISRNGVTFSYDKAGKEIKRTLNNGNVQYRYYDKAGRIVLLKTEGRNRELLFAEGYVYGADGKRSAKVTSVGEVTLYEYDSQGRLSTVWNPATAEMEKLLTEEAEENGLPTLKELKENKYLSGSIQNELSALVYRMNSPVRITPMQLFIKEQYSYDGNGNRITKTTAHGTIKYWYDEENRLLATGSNGVQNVTYSYDRNGNLLKKESKLKTTTYAYNSENRIVYSEVRDIIKKTRTVTNYAYDAFGRRLIVQDNGGTALRSVYDAFTFDVLKEAPTYENGLFTDTGSAGIKFGRTGKPTGERYRYLDDDHKDGNRYYYLEGDSWKNVSSRYTGTRNVLSANNEVFSQFKEESGSEYFIVDEFGSVKGTSDGYGNLNVTYSYDAFGTLVSDDSSVSYGYAGKSYNPATGLYNFGYRDYLPISARFTTQDPIRDGSNWFVYCNGDPVNFVDLWGLEASDTVYTADNLINQEDFDVRYGFSSSKGTQSCKTNSLINVYAADGGVKQSQLDAAVEQWKKDGVIYDDGSPNDLNAMSKTLAKELGRDDYYSLVYPAPDYNQLKYDTQKEFEQSKYPAGIQTQTKNGHTHYTATVKSTDSSEKITSQTLDSLDKNRPGASDYVVTKVEPLQKLKLSK